MASEYLKWKARDVQRETPRELTPQEKRKNWWHYHKWYVFLGMVLLAILCDIGWHVLRTAKPDYQVAYVGTDALPEDTVAALEAGFAALGEDLNGDGRVTVRLVQYASSGGADAGAAYSAEVQLMSDLLDCESFFFLLEDPDRFQLNYHSLCRLDGSLPEENDYSAEGTYLAWDQCPVLAGMELGEYSYSLMGQTVTGDSRALVSRLFLARRGFWTEKSAAYPEGCAALWDKLTEGAIP